LSADVGKYGLESLQVAVYVADDGAFQVATGLGGWGKQGQTSSLRCVVGRGQAGWKTGRKDKETGRQVRQ
jgi:hypothetical protein